MEEMSGRRIYISERSIRASAKTYGQAVNYSYGLAAARGARTIGHQFEGPVLAEKLRQRVASQILGHLSLARAGTFDEELFMCMGYRPLRPLRDEPTLPVILPGEKTYATCYDSENRWYTIATDEVAAERMWTDSEDGDELRARLSVRAEQLPNDLRDLTLIEGELFPVELGSGGNYIKADGPGYRAPQSNRQVHDIDKEVRTSYLRYLDGVFLDTFHDLLDEGDRFTDDEITALANATRVCRNNMSQFESY